MRQPEPRSFVPLDDELPEDVRDFTRLFRDRPVEAPSDPPGAKAEPPRRPLA